MFGTTQRRSVTTAGRFRSGRPRNLVGIDLEGGESVADSRASVFRDLPMTDHVMVTAGRPYYGHFAAWEQPQHFSEELRAAFKPLVRVEATRIFSRAIPRDSD